jgi:hypothetical protein
MKIALSFADRDPKIASKAPIKLKRVRGADGKMMTLRTVDADSKNFGLDLGAVFQRNVTKARKAAAKRTAGKRAKSAPR